MTLRGQLSALSADLIPLTGGSVRWKLAGVHASHAPAQDRILFRMAPKREYSIRDLTTILPGMSFDAIRGALAALARRGLLSCRKSQGGHCARPSLLYSRTQ